MSEEHPHVMKILGGQVFLFAKEILNDLVANSGLVVTGTGFILEKVSLK